MKLSKIKRSSEKSAPKNSKNREPRSKTLVRIIALILVLLMLGGTLFYVLDFLLLTIYAQEYNPALMIRVGLMYEGRLLACDSPARLKASIDHDLLAIWPDDIRRAHNALLDVDLIHEIQTYGDQLRVFVQDADTAMPHVTAALQATGVAVREVRPAPVRMEEVFISLIRRAHDHHGMSSDKDHPPPAGV